MKAIIDPRDAVEHIVRWNNDAPIFENYPNSGRVCQVEPDDQTFPVGEPLFWTDCPDDCKADQFWCNLDTLEIKPIENAPQPAAQDQPNTSGTQPA